MVSDLLFVTKLILISSLLCPNNKFYFDMIRFKISITYRENEDTGRNKKRRKQNP